MVPPPSYTGTTTVLPTNTNTHLYFRTTKVSEWRLEDFIVSTGLTERPFIMYLKGIALRKDLPVEVQDFAKLLKDYYGGAFREEFGVTEGDAHRAANHTLLSGKEGLLLQNHVDNTIESDKRMLSVGRSSQPLLGDKESEGPEGSSDSMSSQTKGANDSHNEEGFLCLTLLISLCLYTSQAHHSRSQCPSTLSSLTIRSPHGVIPAHFVISS
ncbi:hypothetical protein BCR41DRAFT_158664 [Lobosporangium transversale]|uniref:Uncharacterized protein n=1 Tax=Lobosporangium transversale TaxID=64571 RepID=A0A1Y2GDH0_9FUNG|nr:hypothetical protein BCR41DRAFT_158664 [Lobosporangium transversale]ORZ07768.1 hypothetical protein BCR41DRAFT_158664 [Lobosporangium transversale]|eukprot:XP_021878134.1 hypothetical protein BCR41DRAFT_158664 [Lobosporangium transversale]